MYKLREIERRDLKTINQWHNDYELSEKFGGGVSLCRRRGGFCMV